MDTDLPLSLDNQKLVQLDTRRHVHAARVSFLGVNLRMGRRHLGLGAGAAALVVVLLGGGVAFANGGSTIANAPDLPLGEQVASGWSLPLQDRYGEYWRLSLKAGDRLVIDVGVTQTACASGSSRGIDVYSPSVTDYTVGRASPTIEHGTNFNDKDEFVWIAPSPGRWTLFFYGCIKMSYEFTAHLQQFTRVAVSAPTLVAVRHPIRIRGRVTPVASGKVSIKLSTRGGTSSKVVAIKRNGAFTGSFTPKTAGTYKVKVNFYGDSSHRPSAASAVVHVA